MQLKTKQNKTKHTHVHPPHTHTHTHKLIKKSKCIFIIEDFQEIFVLVIQIVYLETDLTL